MCKRFYIGFALIFILGLIFSVSDSALAYSSYHNPIRVHLAKVTSAPSVTVTYGEYQLLNSSNVVVDNVSANEQVTMQAGYRLSSVNGYGHFKYGSYEYRGDLAYYVDSSNNSNYVVNILGLEQYLYSVVMIEIGGYAPALEALKAQAVAARNFACLKLKSPRSTYYDIYSTTTDQAYRGYTGEIKDYSGNSISSDLTDRVRQAVDETKDKVMYYSGTLVNAVYMANAGGCTEDVENVWGSDHDYLQGVSCPWDALPFVIDTGSSKSLKMPPNYEWTVTMSFADLASKLGYSGTITDITVSHDGCDSGYAKKVTVTGTKGTVEYKGTEFRSNLSLKSANLDIIVSKSVAANKTLTLQYITSSSFSSTFTTSGKMITINGRGYGHSVGMSQWSACVMADEGYGYQDILNYFYNQNQNNGKLTFETYQ